jgi:hypothetical protein
MKAIIIDPYAKTISWADLPGTDSYEIIMAALFKDPEARERGTIQAVNIGGNHDLWVDDESLLRPWADQAFFSISGNPPIGGIGLILSHDQEGETHECKGPIQPVMRAVRWVAPQDVVIPAPTIQSMGEDLQPKGEPEVIGGGPATWTFENHGGRPDRNT